ncbi:olfactory receptor 6C70-like [Loxodonta africana]|uniref:olfactory receptor 6C70-like n=1 Tax=Loxodonta africana TaxID=9785 RepID=UPI0030CAB8EE
MIGNLTIIALTLLDSHLKTPVCFFYIFSGVTEFFLLAAVSYDRYVAICKPLHYTSVVSSRLCHQLVLSSWVTAFSVIFPPLTLGLNLDFCASNIIDHFICDISPVLQLSCLDTHLLELIGLLIALMTLIVILLLVIISYPYIIKTILKFPSAQQKKKAFSTCSSHMIVVSITYGCCIFIYIKPSANERVTLSKAVGVLSTSVCPIVEPSHLYFEEPATKRGEEAAEEKSEASRGWILRFKELSHLHHITVRGEAASADAEAAASHPGGLAERTEEGGYTRPQVCNVDETALYGKKMPFRTFEAKEEMSLAGF